MNRGTIAVAFVAGVLAAGTTGARVTRIGTKLVEDAAQNRACVRAESAGARPPFPVAAFARIRIIAA